MQVTDRQPHRAPERAPDQQERHRQGQNMQYRLVKQHAATFFARAEAEAGADLQQFVQAHSQVPVWHWAQSLPIPLRLPPLAAQPKLLTPVLQVVRRATMRSLLQLAGIEADGVDSGAVTKLAFLVFSSW